MSDTPRGSAAQRAEEMIRAGGAEPITDADLEATCPRAEAHEAMSMQCRECGYRPGPGSAACPECGGSGTWPHRRDERGRPFHKRDCSLDPSPRRATGTGWPDGK